MSDAADVPRLKGFDHTIGFVRAGYGFVQRHCDALGTDRFRARIMLRPVLCARGESAARMFYGGEAFTRQGAMPPTVLRLLQDKGSVQVLDGASHRHRKALFVDLLMGDAPKAAFIALFEEEWNAAMAEWAKRREIVLFDEVNLVLTRAVCRWTGVPVDQIGAARLCHELTSMIENAGRIGPAVLVALNRRRRTEARIKALLDKVRADEHDPASMLGRIVRFKDHDGRALDPESATVEVLNILRPTVAIGRFIMFAAMALHEHPQWRAALNGAPDAAYEAFTEEVRRVYPFFPVVGGVARETLDWNGCRIGKGDWVLLDLFGTDHDPRRFPAPAAFDPDRAPSWRAQGFDFVPQGGGHTPISHRCPGEELTVAVICAALRFLVERMDYSVPQQDLSLSLNRMPARPRSGFRLSLSRVRQRDGGNIRAGR